MTVHLDPASTAVLALHWLNDVVAADGRFGSTFHPMVRDTGAVDRTRTLLATARSAGAPVVHVRVCFRPGYPDLLVNNQLLAAVKATGALVDGEDGAEIIDALAPEPPDAVISHRRLTAFHGTELDTLLRIRNVDTLLLTGVATNITVEGTAREAINLGYRTIVVADCCAAADQAAHDASLATLAFIAEVATAADILGALP
jgi:nicotinamidase-related amidase